MDKFLNKTKKIIFTEQGGIISSTLILSAMIIISRIFGFLRYRILSGFFETGQLDIYFASFRIPDLVFEILITGALTSSFIPIFIKYQHNKKDLDTIVSSIINILSIFLFFFIGILFFAMDRLIPAITPGFNSEKVKIITEYSKILLVAQLPFLVFGNFLTGIAQANKTFLVTAIAPVLYNIMVIIITLLGVAKFHLFAPILGVIIGSFIFFLVQIPVLGSFNLSYLLTIKITTGVKEFFRIIVPRILTVLLAQIDTTIDLTLSTLLGTGSYTVFYFAQHLQLLPVSVVGIAFGQASLPYLTEMFEQKKIEELKNIIVSSILNLFFLTIPFMGFFIVARTPLVRMFFGGQKYDWSATVETAYTLSYFALSLPFHTIYYFLTRCFYAVLDSKTPFVMSLISIVINTVLSVISILLLHLPIWSLALSFSISMIINVTFLIILLSKKIPGLHISYLIKSTIKIILSLSIAFPVTYFFIKLTDGLIFDTSRTINVFFLLVISSLLYFGLYIITAWFFEIKEIFLITNLLLRAKEYKQKITSFYSLYE
ncbi:murein biosynthesis integral membrane protein MurJ [Candidatus Roizmanbacteria bacterium CG_4_10_14_0_8_um_filter_33_9]|uniref:Lipid II flippase n=1 Tax=Candidatus Roizmanbacteria bacterium CG_4_10_14_0_8_um_filter_33_9 TaxID=1974826 RepID=A0A2M7QI14_9BACT|nr:MAG: murein biosynthesis integral membrane protein MurJ [Candidatus Roizmanbacteria bacterium CG_4_10_14_0_8_um_filter_33_9]